MRFAFWIGLRVGLLCLSFSNLVWAQISAEAAPTERYRLSWVRGKGAEECPGAEQLAQAVRQRLGRDPFASEAARDIEGSVARIDDFWQARLNVLDAHGVVLGSRDLSAQAPTCALLADAVALAIALTIDPSPPLNPPANAITPAPIQPLPAPMATVSPPPAAPAPAPAPPRQRAPASSTFGMGASANGSILFGGLPRPAAGGELGVDLRLARPFRLALGVAFYSEARTNRAEFAIGLTAASLGACFDALNKPKVGLDACAGFQAGALHVVVYSPDPTSPGERLWLAGRIGPRLRWRFAPPVELVLGGAAVLPLIRHDFAVEGQPPLFETPAVGFCAGVGLGTSIP